jgi:hypothetical protein
MTEVLELKKRYARLYKPSADSPSIVEVPTLRFLMLDGDGPIGGPQFAESFEALYKLAYPVKFSAKKQLDLSYPVMPSEGLYWDADGGPEVPLAEATRMVWRLLLMLPDEISSEFVDEVREKVLAKKSLPRLADIRVQSLTEGTCAQVLHIGPYAAETPTVNRLRAFAAEKGYEFSGIHHEIYLSDPNRTAPEKLKTILRYPVRPQR